MMQQELSLAIFRMQNRKKKSITDADEVFDHYLADLGIPVVKGFKIGHCSRILRFRSAWSEA